MLFLILHLHLLLY
jgi:hypothetical protein